MSSKDIFSCGLCVFALQAGVGMDAPLVDVEGFPRADVDLYKVRTARHNISCEYIFTCVLNNCGEHKKCHDTSTDMYKGI